MVLDITPGMVAPGAAWYDILDVMYQQQTRRGEAIQNGCERSTFAETEKWTSTKIAILQCCSEEVRVHPIVSESVSRLY